MSKFIGVIFVGLFFGIAMDGFAQKPAWVDEPGALAADNFVSIGIAKDKKPDKARNKAEKKARQGIEGLLKKKYPKKDIKSALTQIRLSEYWLDPSTGYQYVLALLPMESIDKDYATRKKAERAKNSAMGAIQMLNATVKDPDIVVIAVDEEDDGVSAMADNDGGGHRKAGGESQGQAITDFANKSFGKFKWIDQDGNSKYSFLGENLTATLAAYETFKPEDGDKKAPRIEYEDVSGDFVIVSRVKMDWEKYYNVGIGLYALSGQQNVFSYVKYNGAYLHLGGFANDIALPRTEKGIDPLKNFAFFKLERRGYTFTASYSTVEDDWIEIGSVETEFPATCSVGLVLTNEEDSSVAVKCDFVRITN